MIADLKPYPEYKESGLPWLGPVPGHWEIRQARQIGRLLKGVGGTKEDAVPEGVACVRYGELYTTHSYFIRASKTFIRADRAASYAPIRYGDVLFAASGETIEEIGKSAVNLMQTSAVCGGDVIVLRPSIPVHAPFLGYAMDCRPATNQKATMGKGTTVKHIYPDELRNLLVPLPTLEEQAAIVRFLDWANGRLERAIRAKSKVIALLNEQKQAIIHRAVTRGLDLNVRLKPSGVEWLGDVPEHWHPTRLKDVASVQTGITLGKNYGAAPTRRYPYLRVANVQIGRVDLRHVKYIMAPEHEAHGCMLRSGDVLMTEGGDIDKLGRGCIWNGEVPGCIHQNHVFAVRCTSRLLPEFLVGLMASDHGRAYFQSTAKQTTNLACTNSTTLRAFPFFLPDIDEQGRILSHISQETAGLGHAITICGGEIELVREYRTRLIADVVTGKLDVREAAARLPDETEEPEPIEESDLPSEAGEEAEDEVEALPEGAEA